MKTIRLEGAGIAWNGLFTSVLLTALSETEKGQELETSFKELASTKETVNFAVDYPEYGEVREGTGIVESYDDDGNEVRVGFRLDSSVALYITK